MLRHFLKTMQSVFIKERTKKRDAAKRCIEKTKDKRRKKAIEFHKHYSAAFMMWETWNRRLLDTLKKRCSIAAPFLTNASTGYPPHTGVTLGGQNPFQLYGE